MPHTQPPHTLLLKVEIERSRDREVRVRARQRRQERVAQSLVHAYALRRVEHQHATQQVDRVRRRVREARLQRLRLTQHTQHHDRRTEVQLRHHVTG